MLIIHTLFSCLFGQPRLNPLPIKHSHPHHLRGVRQNHTHSILLATTAQQSKAGGKGDAHALLVLLQPPQPFSHVRLAILPHRFTHLPGEERSDEAFSVPRADHSHRLVAPHARAGNAAQAAPAAHAHPTASTAARHYDLVILRVRSQEGDTVTMMQPTVSVTEASCSVEKETTCLVGREASCSVEKETTCLVEKETTRLVEKEASRSVERETRSRFSHCLRRSSRAE